MILNQRQKRRVRKKHRRIRKNGGNERKNKRTEKKDREMSLIIRKGLLTFKIIQ